MPHLTLEHSAGCGAGVDFAALLPRLNRTVADTLGTAIDNCKARVLRLDTYQVGERRPGSEFVHLDMLVLEGRGSEVKRHTAEAVLALLREAFEADLDGLQITVDTREIERAVYAKYPAGTLTPVAAMR